MAELEWDGKPRKVLLHAPKNGFSYVLDRADGKLPGFWNGGTVTSAGNLVIHGTSSGHLHTYSADRGRPLWSLDTGVGISAPPVIYAVAGKQYVAVLAGWGGAVYLGSTALDSTAGLTAPTRAACWYFHLMARQHPPPTRAPQMDVAIVEDPRQIIDISQATVGQDRYLSMCLGCHGIAVISVGGAPDLRASKLAANLDSFRQLLHTGALQSCGMPRFQELNPREMEQIYWFIRQRARESLPENATLTAAGADGASSP